MIQQTFDEKIHNQIVLNSIKIHNVIVIVCNHIFVMIIKNRCYRIDVKGIKGIQFSCFGKAYHLIFIE